nr:transposase [Streptomyces sp. CB01249]
MAEHDQRPGGRAGREGRGRHPARLPVRAGRPLRPRRWQASGDDRHRHRLLQRHCLRAAGSGCWFGLLALAGFAYAPQLADLPDQKMWRIDRTADYGAFQQAARGRVDLTRIERHWEDILRIIGSIHTGAVRAYDVIRMLSRDGRPTPLGDAIAHYGRIAKTLHILRLADEPGYRHHINVLGRYSFQLPDLPGGLRPLRDKHATDDA